MESPSLSIDVPVVLELFALDTTACDPCVSAMASLHAAAAELSKELSDQGYVVATRVVRLEDAAHARELGIASSPTVRVNGHDVAVGVEEDECPSCSSLAGTTIHCRTYDWDGQRLDHPPAALVTDAVRRHVGAAPVRRAGGSTSPAGDATSVERFFAARAGDR